MQTQNRLFDDFVKFVNGAAGTDRRHGPRG